MDKDNPLSKRQESLRGRKPSDMSEAQLHEWIDACDKMEAWVKPPKARRMWKQAGEEAEAELASRAQR
jgi:hypothetical protein